MINSFDKNSKTILVSNTRPYSDSNSIAADIASILARKGKKIAVIDADLRHPYMHKVFGVKNNAGLAGILLQDQPIQKIRQFVNQQHISLISAGHLAANADDPLKSKAMEDMVERLKIMFDKVIIHGPAFSYLEASSLAGMVDNLVLLVHPGHVKTRMYQSIVERFQKKGTRIVGVVMRDQPKQVSSQSAFLDRLLTYDRQVQKTI